MHALPSLFSRACLVALGASVSLPALAAYQFYMESFLVARLFPDGTTDPEVIFSDTNGYVKFLDDFDAGGPPPDLTGVINADMNSNGIGDFSYGVDTVLNGTVGPETIDGRLSLSFADAVPHTSPAGTQNWRQFQILRAESGQGLGRGISFAVGGVFQWAVPEAGHAYGIQVQDRNTSATPANEGDDIISLRVRGAGGGLATARLMRSVYASAEAGDEFQVGNHVLADLDLVAPAETAYVGLWLNHATAFSDPLAAEVLFLDAAGDILPGSRLSVGTVDIFHGETSGYRPAFFALQPVPEPRAWALLLAGLGVVGWVAGRRQAAD